MKTRIKSIIKNTIVLPLILLAPIPSLTSSYELKSLHQNPPEVLTLGMVVYDEFELLDVFGPLEMFGLLRDKVNIVLIAEKLGSARSSAGPSVTINKTFEQVGNLDILLVPGGEGSLEEINNKALLDKIKTLSEKSTYVGTICTGSALLAKTDLLNGKKATSNKESFQWVTEQNRAVDWVREARWVEDGKYFTSSGVSAGTDMSLAMIAKIYGIDTAVSFAKMAEYEWNDNPHHDIFAKKYGLID
ncbi:DJ-1/PfpI family protein [Xenorhabdus sp. 12]|uniref:DJ-1/PfpI family protein n=1 Tax=Xenorhabdus santafensis TaxID=2582833 RepID=A0ABU4SB45_9GAMM|nr:DJ-1/PfpI family protein [Xenorhabdus sp. 12]MDX7988028.1 DJ-1/PfpI family protein [Xenorhabdus sp. 12]